MRNKYIDVHAHLYLCKEKENDLLDAAHEAGLTHIVNIAINIGSSRKVLVTHQRQPNCLPTVGIHPCETNDFDKMGELEDLLKVNHQKIVAIAEIGLDYYWQQENKAAQQRVFTFQLDLAQRYKLPVIIHNRKADADIVAITKNFPEVTKIFHCFAGGPQLLETLAADNHYFSFTGQITHAKKGKTIQAIKVLDLDHCLIETDSPYLTPLAYKGQSNQPAYLPEIAQKIAEVKQIDLRECSQKCYQNSLRLFVN
ncbi:MAG: TatD family hydrolase [bacterium]